MSKYTDQDIVDENGNKILASSLDANYIYHQSWGTKDSTADTDGRLRLRDGKGKYINKVLEYQLKSTKKLNSNKYHFKRKDIDYQLTCNIPTISFVVDVTEKKIFWYFFKDKINEHKLNENSSGRTINLTSFEVNGNCKQLKNIWEKIAKSDTPSSSPTGGSSALNQDPTEFKEETPSQVQSVLDYSVISEYQSELNLSRDLINQRKPQAALAILEDLKKRVWDSSDNKVKFRILTNIGASNLALEEEEEACKFFIEAYQYNSEDEKAISNLALAYLLSGDTTKAAKYAKETLDKNLGNQQALSIYFQAANKSERDKLLRELPSNIKNSPEIYFSLGYVELKQESYKQSVTYLRRAIELDGDKSLEIPSTLAGVLIEKNLPILKKLELEGLKEKNNEEVDEAINLLTHVWDKVKDTEMAKAKVSWLVNRSFAKRILGKYDEALVDAKRSYELSPDNLKVVRNYALLLWEVGNLEESFKLLIPYKNDKEFLQATYLLALIKRDEQDFDTALSILKKEVSNKQLPDNHREDGLSLLLETYLMAGKQKEAEKLIKNELKKNDNNTLILIFSSKIAEEQKDTKKAKNKILKAFSSLNNTSSYHDKFMVASQLYKLKLFDEAQEIYEEITDKTVYSQILYRLLYCYYETNNYAKALALARSVTRKQGAIEDVLKIQMAIQEEQGNLKGVMDTCETLIASNPSDTASKLQKGYILIRQNKLKEVDEYLDKTRFDLDSLSLMSRYRLAYLFSIRSKLENFLNTMYETRRKFFDDKRAHVEYIKLFFMRAPETDVLLEARKVANNTAVFYRYPNGKTEHYVIEDRSDASKALKEIKPDEELALKLHGKMAGDKIEISPRLFIEVIEVKSKFIHALHESLALHQSLFNNVQDLQSIHLGEVKKEGELPEGFKVIEQQITAQHEHAQKVEALYRDRKLTIGAFAHLAGKSLIEIWGGMVFDEKLGVNFARGDLQERVQALSHLKTGVKLVVDPVALLTIHSLEIGGLIVQNYGKLGIGQTTIDLLTDQITRLEPIKDKGYLSLGKQGEQFTKWEVMPETIKSNIDYLERLVAWVKKNCDVLQVEKAEDIGRKKKENLERIIGTASADTLLLCRVKDRILFSDDERLRALARGEYGTEGIWTQALLMESLGKGYIEQEQYDDLVVKLVGLNYYYTSVSGRNLFFALKKSDWKTEKYFASCVKMLNPAFSDTSSATKVCVDFLHELFTYSLVVGNIDEILFNIFDNLTKDRRASEVLPILKRELAAKFYFLPLNLEEINKVLDKWSKTKVY